MALARLDHLFPNKGRPGRGMRVGVLFVRGNNLRDEAHAMLSQEIRSDRRGCLEPWHNTYSESLARECEVLLF